MQSYEFHIDDNAGAWGDMRANAESKEQAEQAIREQLEREEVEPNGSLLPDFTVTHFATGAAVEPEEAQTNG